MDLYKQLNAIFEEYGLSTIWKEEELKEGVDHYFSVHEEEFELGRFCDYMIASLPYRPNQKIKLENIELLKARMPSIRHWGKEEEMMAKAFVINLGDGQSDFHLNFEIDPNLIWQLDVSHPVMRKFYQRTIPQQLWKEYQLSATFDPARARYLVHEATAKRLIEMKNETRNFEAPDFLKTRMVEKLTQIYQMKQQEIEASKLQKRKLFGVSLPSFRKK